MSRQVLPPAGHPTGSAPQQTAEVLENRLTAAEDETNILLEQLNGLGFSKTSADINSSNMKVPVSPYKVRMASNDVLKDNYEALVSRVCKMESTVQTMKLNLLNIQGENHLKGKSNDEFEYRMNVLKQTYEQTISKYKREMEQMKEDLLQENEEKNKLKSNIKDLKSALEDSSTTRAEATVTADELSLTKQKMQRRINELKEECDREKSLRKSLEESHNTLMERVRDMEALVESERKEVKSLSMDCQSLRNDALNVREELKLTQAQRDSIERDYNEAYEEMERMKRNFETMDSDRQVLMKELDRLRKQYDDLIKQLEQTQVIVDQQKEMLLIDKVTLANQNNELKAERSRVAEKERIEEEALQYKIKTKELTAERESLEKRLRHVEQEYTGLNKKFVAKDDEYCQAASGLEKELNSLRHQLQVVKKEKERAVKDKDHLLDEVNQTVDSMIEERSKLQGEAQQLKIELDSQKKLRKSLEHENATLMERVSGFEGQQETQSKVEKTMMEMMEQKNKLAYENGSLQTQVTHLTAEVDKLKNAQNDATKLKHINEGLQNRYDKTQKEMSDLKIKTQRLDSQLRQKHGSYETKEKDYNELQKQRDEAVKERDTLILQIQDMEDKDQSKEYVMEWLDMSKINGLQRNLEDAKAVNKEIASTLEAVMSSHSHLQTVVEELQTELGKKDSTITAIKNQKSSAQQEWKFEMKQFEERMENLRGELKKERDKSLKKNSRDIAEVRKQNDNLSTRNMELVKANTELRHKMTEYESQTKDLKDKIRDQKKRVEYLHKSKKDLEENSEKVRELKSEIEDLENLRDEYVKRNTDQGEMINTFMNQIASLQVELKQLAQNQAETNLLIQQREVELEKERTVSHENKRKYEHTVKQKDDIDRMRRETENRLKEAQDESSEISVHLQDAHDWFRNKFEKLQNELVTSKRKQEDLVQDTEEQKRKADEEKLKAHAAVEKAKAMIREVDKRRKNMNSRESISRLADYANVADNETKHQLQKLQQQLQREKDHNKYLEMKHGAYKEASVRQMECLLKEFNQ
ncbi:coiled-coil domain-containing protein 150-like isoform X5 [Mytilus californianus]|uniref:coiled-coil domain-containing protein 150-like isoform X5 n=1 Tax=Mytilus californianus TaxID=6549 RepID=UPI0022485AC5|nr:coiled-coil domain-containing protein 150-like isoform X5 [Mytilus californianus]